MSIGIRLAWRNLWRHSRRTWLTTAAMTFSNVLLVLMISIQVGTYSLMLENGLRVFTGHIQIQHPKYFDETRIQYSIAVPENLFQQLKKIGGVSAVALKAESFALASSAQRSYGVQVMGVQPDAEAGVSSIPGLIKQGRYLRAPLAQEIVLGSTLTRNLKVAIGEEITIFGGGKDGSSAAAILTLVGVFDSGLAELDRSIVQIPLQTFQAMFSMEGEVHRLVIVADSLDQVAVVEDRVKAILNGPEFRVLDWNELQPGLKQAIQADMASSGFMYIVLIVLVAFSVLNTQLMSVLERTREYGIVMALGLTSWRLGRLVILETALMSALGLLLGAGLGAALVSWLSQVGLSYPGMEEMSAKFNLPDRIYPQLTLFTVFFGPVLVFIACIFAALYPALRLHRLQPVDAMKAL